MTEFVATLIAPPGSDAALEAALTALTAAIPAARTTWLGEGEAVDIAFEAGDAPPLARLVQALPVDLVVQPAAHRRKRLLVADMDSTMIAQECIDELADYAGFRAEVASLTERAMAGEIAFAPALHERAALLTGLTLETLAEVLATRITTMAGARTLVATMRAHGAATVLVSGGFTDFAEPVGRLIGFDRVKANRLLVADGRLTGKVGEPVVGPDAKRETLEEEAARLAIPREETLAVGDGANDIAMVEAAGLGVAYHAKPKLAAIADARIDHADLTALLYMQGYRRSDFVV
ncbi:MAG: phosphoserine phosphatase SerB [Bauldia sp.]|nr:phosphoserine phosphatase SerB [Bauldia sp.]